MMGEFLVSLLRSVLLKRKIKIIKGQNNLRSYIYITDVIKMLLNIFFKGKKNVYNVGGNSKVTILNLGKKISKLTSAKFLSKKNDKSNDGAPEFAKIDIKRYEKEFGKLKFVNLNDGLEKLLIGIKN